MSTWVYIQSEPGLWTVGHFDPDGRWHTDSDKPTQQAAAERCAWLNGSRAPELISLEELAAQAAEERRHASEEMAAIIMALSKSATLETNATERMIYWTEHGWVVEDDTAEELWHCGPHLEQALCRLLAIGEEPEPVSPPRWWYHGRDPDAPTPAQIDADRHIAGLDVEPDGIATWTGKAWEELDRLQAEEAGQVPTLDDLAQQAATACAEASRAIVAWWERAVPNLAELLAELSESQEET